MSRDPIAERGGQNLYGYCYQSPLNYLDPNGRSPVPLLMLLIGVLFISGDEAVAADSVNDLAFDLISQFYFGDGTTQYYLDSDYGNALKNMESVRNAQSRMLATQMKQSLCREEKKIIANPPLGRRLYGRDWLSAVANLPAIAAINDVDLELIYTCQQKANCCYDCNLVWSVADRFDANIDDSNMVGWIDRYSIFLQETFGVDYIDPNQRNIMAQKRFGRMQPLSCHPRIWIDAISYDWKSSWEETKEICCDP